MFDPPWGGHSGWGASCYAAIAVGTFFEGEVVLSIAGYAARQGVLRPEAVVLAGAVGAIASDQTCFWLGRIFGKQLLGRWPSLESRVDQALENVRRWRDALILGFQFIPGTCTVVPLAAGMSRMKAARFAAVDFVGASFWSLILTGVGYVWGATAHVAPGRRPWAIHAINLGLLAAGLVAIAAVRRRWLAMRGITNAPEPLRSRRR